MSRSTVPYVIGQWVCGPQFYGRAAEITEILGSAQRWQWIAGLRRIGKTSLLKQLDHLTGSGDRPEVALFWDLQGVESAEDLGLTFTDALLDAEEALARHGISAEEVEDGDVFASLEKLAGALQQQNAGLLLLCDEADELMPLSRAAPGLVERLWQSIAGFPATRVVVASSLRLCDSVAEGAEWMERFGAPRYLGAMTDDDARALLQQSQLPAAARPAFDEAGVEAIRTACGDHPMLLQIVAKRFHEIGDLEETFLQVTADRAIQHLFSVDFALLAEAERQLLRGLVAERSAVDASIAQRLLTLGLLRGNGSGVTIPNRFLASWLRQ
jgi:hypothetical protein